MKKKDINLKKLHQLKMVSIGLPASKSISNRALIISALSGNDTELSNLSTARDTDLMKILLFSEENELNAMDAGTTTRFLTAYLAITNQNKTLTGTPRMCKRPIKILVEALRELGALIDYKMEPGYPPLHIKGFPKQLTNRISIQGDISSQYISALMMISPTLPNGLEITLTGRIGSIPYITMTLEIMKTFGAVAEMKANVITVEPGGYRPVARFVVEPDWSAASYWYSFVALSDQGSITLTGLTDKSLQGDRVIADIMKTLGVKTTFTKEGAVLEKTSAASHFDYNFIHCPDLAQTVAVVCAAKRIPCKMTGLESLKIKETDRVAAIQNELKKTGVSFREENNAWYIDQFDLLVDK
ncbi:MAG: 3-phosphoshikimate 1-carboxyvinyltransferase, partial [Cyclobacteriaceae bacterium]|nr:3-phosphoshikimate 1-carboxyvinyltransferase [Cyclobacteriaceae bacterium]